MDFGAIINWLKGVWSLVWIFVIVRHYEEGVLLRFGKYKRSLKPGLHFKWSFCEEIFTQFAKDDTILLPTQMLTTYDDITVSVRGQVTYYIDDIRLFLTEVNDGKQAISDMIIGAIADNVMKGNYEDCRNDVILNQINIEVRREARKWGVYIIKMKLPHMCKSRTINLTKDTEAHL